MEVIIREVLERGGTVVLDGGLATELERRGHDLSDRLWSARLLAVDPAAIGDVHRAFFAAGAQLATTASYQATFQGFAAAGVDRREAELLLRRSVAVARDAARNYPGTGVAASIGPYGAMLADGSEYTGDYGLSVAELRAFHRPRLAVLAESGPDVLACETVPCLAEAEALLAELATIQLPAWLSLTVAGDRTRRGEPAIQAFRMAADVESVIAVGVNCCDPAGLSEMVAAAHEASGKPAVVYPNSGEIWDANARRWTGPAGYPPADARGWVRAGAGIVGGCCRVTPEHIAAVAGAVLGSGSAGLW